MAAPLKPTDEAPNRDMRPAATVRSSGWVLKRALIGVALITIFAAGGAALMHASIEPEQPAAAGE